MKTVVILYLYSVMGSLAWVYSGEYADATACHKAAEVLGTNHPVNNERKTPIHVCIDKSTGQSK